MKTVTMFFDETDLQELKELAAKRRIKFSQLVRIILAEYLQQNRPTQRKREAAQNRGK